MNKNHRIYAMLTTTVLAYGVSAPTFSQTPVGPTSESAPSASVLEDIIVTARKRVETSLASPVVLTTITGGEIERRSLTDLVTLGSTVPGLVLTSYVGSQGGTLAMRGISGPPQNGFGDQAVAFNVDGVQVAHTSVIRMGEMDLAQMEVLKGPQALFFGKNSPGGIITLRTADPTQHLEAKVSSLYEFNAREKRGEGYVSGPINDDLGFRVTLYGDGMDGNVRNILPTGAYLASTTPNRYNGGEEYGVRGTLKYDAGKRFDARFKVSYAREQNAGPVGQTQKISCPFGTPQTGTVDDCKADSISSAGSPGPLLVGVAKYFGNGENYGDQEQVLSSLELNYKFNDQITLTSVTGLYAFTLSESGNYTIDYALDLPASTHQTDREWSEELRLQSNYDWPLNFMVGGFLSSTHQTLYNTAYIYAAEPSAVPLLISHGYPGTLRTLNGINFYDLTQDGRSYSGFMQLSYKPISTVEITGGGRYSYEDKNLPFYESQGNTGNILNPLGPGTVVHPRVSDKNWTDFSPEMTVAYRPVENLNFFASYKHGFLSGGFNATTLSPTGDNSYNPETIKGYEVGAKASLLGGRLRTNAAAYTYKAAGLQVTSIMNAVSFLRNAAGVKIQGVEGDFNYLSTLQGLSLHGAIAYNDGKYTSFPNAACFAGETPAQGCTFSPSAKANVQNLLGRRMNDAPLWAGNAGFTYEIPISRELKIGLSSDGTFSGSYFADAADDPVGQVHAYALVDASLKLAQAEDRWEVALIGRNLGDRRIWGLAQDTSFTGGKTGTAAGVPADRQATLTRGREIMIRASVNFQ